jgi:hypothetical protein
MYPHHQPSAVRRRAAQLHARQPGAGRHPGELPRAHCHPGPFRKEIGIDLAAWRGLGHLLEIVRHLGRPGRQEIRRDRGEPGRHQRYRRLGEQPGPVRVGGPDVRQHPPGARDVKRGLDQAEPLGVGEGGELPGGTRHEHPPGRPGDETEQLAGRHQVQVAGFGERGRDRRDHLGRAGHAARPFPRWPRSAWRRAAGCPSRAGGRRAWRPRRPRRRGVSRPAGPHGPRRTDAGRGPERW